MSAITLSDEEIEAITGYKTATKALNVLHARGFHRAFINRKGQVVLERAHYEAVAAGDSEQPSGKVTKKANLDFL